LTQTQVTGGTYDVTNASCIIHASGNWNTTTPPTVGAIATAVWQDATGADFTTSSSIGKLLYNMKLDASGYILLSTGTGTGQISFTSGIVAASGNWLTDKTGYSGTMTVGGYATNQDPLTLLTGGAYTIAVDANHKVAVPDTQKVSVNSYESNQGPLYLLTGAAYTLAVDSSHRVTVGSNADKTGYALTTADWAKAGDAMKISTGTGAGQLTITSGVVAASGDWNVGKTGYALSSDGLDSVSTTDPTGFPTTFTQKVIALFNRMFSKSELTALTFTTYKANGTTPMMIQSVSDDETTQTVNKGSTP
jgi:hypothetical protein